MNKCPFCKERPLLLAKTSKTCGDPICRKARKKARQKAYMKAYYQKPENKARIKAYRENPENNARIKARDRAYQKAYYQKPEVKARKKAYRENPEYKARDRAYQKAYYQKPENKARIKARMKAYYKLMTININAFSFDENYNYKQRKEFKELFNSLFKSSLKQITNPLKKETVNIRYLIKKTKQINDGFDEYRIDGKMLKGKYAKSKWAYKALKDFRKHLHKHKKRVEETRRLTKSLLNI